MELHGKSLAITITLVVVLVVVVMIEISLFVAGPSRKYEAKVSKQEDAILEKYQNIEHLSRHVFQYTVYIGEDDGKIVWFNEKAEAIVSKEKKSLDNEAALKVVSDTYGLETAEVTLGYGYDNPVYVVTSGDVEVMLDYDTKKVVHYMDKGVAK